jgi:hypothetical protein
MLLILHNRFHGFIGENEQERIQAAVSRMFKCTAYCGVCKKQCSQTLEHVAENEPHATIVDNLKKGCIYNPSIENVVYYCPRCKLSGNNDGPSLLSYNYTGYHYDDSSWGSKIDWYMKNAVNGPYLLTVRGYVHQCDKCGFYLNNRDGLLWPNNLGEKLETEYTHKWKNK